MFWFHWHFYTQQSILHIMVRGFYFYSIFRYDWKTILLHFCCYVSVMCSCSPKSLEMHLGQVRGTVLLQAAPPHPSVLCSPPTFPAQTSPRCPRWNLHSVALFHAETWQRMVARCGQGVQANAWRWPRTGIEWNPSRAESSLPLYHSAFRRGHGHMVSTGTSTNTARTANMSKVLSKNVWGL